MCKSHISYYLSFTSSSSKWWYLAVHVLLTENSENHWSCQCNLLVIAVDFGTNNHIYMCDVLLCLICPPLLRKYMLPPSNCLPRTLFWCFQFLSLITHYVFQVLLLCTALATNVCTGMYVTPA